MNYKGLITETMLVINPECDATRYSQNVVDWRKTKCRKNLLTSHKYLCTFERVHNGARGMEEGRADIKRLRMDLRTSFYCVTAGAVFGLRYVS